MGQWTPDGPRRGDVVPDPNANLADSGGSQSDPRIVSSLGFVSYESLLRWMPQAGAAVLFVVCLVQSVLKSFEC
jgi:hypothetical protein